MTREQLDRALAETETSILKVRAEIESRRNRGLDIKDAESLLQKLQSAQAQRYKERDQLLNKEQLAQIDRLIAQTETRILQTRAELQACRNRGQNTKPLESSLRTNPTLQRTRQGKSGVRNGPVF